MKREIKFRGKAKDGGIWLHGDLTTGNTIHTSPSWHEDGEGEWWGRECHEETIGQYTGLKDKNDKDIYEGDIVVYPEENKPCEVIYRASDYGASFLTDSYDGVHSLGDVMNIIEVIGNIHDNPELIERSKE